MVATNVNTSSNTANKRRPRIETLDSSDDEVENVTVIEQSQAKTDTKPAIKKTIKKPEPDTETDEDEEEDEQEEEDSKNIVKKYVIPKKKITKQEQEKNRHTLYVYNQTTLIEKIEEDIADFKRRIKKLFDYIALLRPSEVTDEMKKALSFTPSDLSVSLDYAYKTIKQVKNTNTFMVYNDLDGWVIYESDKDLEKACLNSVMKISNGKLWYNIFIAGIHRHVVTYDFDSKLKSVDHIDNFVNIYTPSPYKLKNYKPNEDFVELFKTYLLDIFSGGNTVLYEIVPKWVANMLVHGNKNNLCFTNISTQKGIGKSVFSDLIVKLMAKSMVKQIKINELVQFTNKIKNKLFLVMDETGTYDNSTRISVNTTLKNYITNDEFVFEGKHANTEVFKATANFYFSSNLPADFIDYDERRAYDIKSRPEWQHLATDSKEQTQEKDDKWKRLKTTNKDDLQALYNFLETIDVSTDINGKKSEFNAQLEIGMTIKKDAVIEHVALLSPYQFVKDKYILKKTGMVDVVNTKMYDSYTCYCESNGLKAVKKMTFYSMLGNIEIASMVGTGNKSYYNYSFEKLRFIFVGRKYLTTAERFESGYDKVDANGNSNNVKETEKDSQRKAAEALLSKFTEDDIRMLKQYFTNMD